MAGMIKNLGKELKGWVRALRAWLKSRFPALMAKGRNRPTVSDGWVPPDLP